MTEARIAELVDRAFDYRGYVTLRRSDGSELVGFVYDRTASHLEIFDETATRRTRIALDEIADIAFTGEDAARKSQEVWERRKGQLEPRDTPAHGEWGNPGKVLVVVALEQELQPVARALGVTARGGLLRGWLSGSEVVALAVGIGGDVRSAVAQQGPRLVMSCGFCGGLDPAMSAGDLVLATRVRGADGQVLDAPEVARQAAARALNGLRFTEGELVCTSAVAASNTEKRALARAGALAVDMETYPVARAAREAGVPWLALRAVVDPLDFSLPPFAREGRARYLGPALEYALCGPRAAAKLVRLARNASLAAAALTAALRRLGPALSVAEARR